MALLHGSFEDKYEVLSRLRQGGMGAVYKVRHRLLDEMRAVKVIRSWAVGSEEAAGRFLREARVASRLRHPNLAILHDFAVDEGGDAYLVSEFIDGWTFREILRRQGPPALALGLEMARQSLKALGYLHRQRILHRDVSPDNLMLTRDADGLPLVKLIDLGIAKALEDGAGATESGVFLGKPRYASPEQFAEAAVDQRSDLYSFGVVLYELLTGRCPISGHDSLTLMAGHLSRPPLGFEVSDPEGRIPPDLRQILLDALEKNPEDRIPTAEDFAGALAAIQTRYPVAEEDLAAMFAIPSVTTKATVLGAREEVTAEATARTEKEEKEEEEAEATSAGSLSLLPLAADASGEDLSAVGDVTWAERRREPGLVWEPLGEDADAVPPGVHPMMDADAMSPTSPLLFRLALITAGLLLLLVFARAFWPPVSTPLKDAPKWAELKVTPPPAQLPAPAPVISAPVVPESVVPEPVVPEPARAPEPPAPPTPKVEERTAAVKPAPEAAPEPAPEIVEPAPEIVEVRPRPVTPRPAPPKRQAAPAPRRASEPEVAVAVARREPEPWEEEAQPSGLLKPGPGVEEPVPLNFPRYGYPTEARGTGLRADVRLALLVDEQGKVIDARVREGAPSSDFARTALAAARRIPFQPATRRDVPGKMWTEVILEFVE